MTSPAKTVEEYLSQVPADKVKAVTELRKAIKKNLPKGFKEIMNYGMIGYVVPHSIFPAGYHCDPKLPLPFMGLAAQKNSVNFYHMGIYASPELLKWFTTEFPKHSTKKLDMGKSCIRFSKAEDIPLKLLGELCAKMTPQKWIDLYQEQLNKTAKPKATAQKKKKQESNPKRVK